MDYGKQVPNFPNYYIDERGKIFDIKKGRYVTPVVSTTGSNKYLNIKLRRREDGKLIEKSFFIHRLVASLYIENPEELPQVIHIDGDVLNNSVDNLKWVEAKEYRKDALSKGWYTSKLSPSKVLEIKRLLSEGVTQAHIASKFGVSRGTINKINRGKSWIHLKHEYDFRPSTPFIKGT